LNESPPEERTFKSCAKRMCSAVAELLKYNLRTVRAYLLREDFQRFWEYSRPS